MDYKISKSSSKYLVQSPKSMKHCYEQRDRSEKVQVPMDNVVTTLFGPATAALSSQYPQGNKKRKEQNMLSRCVDFESVQNKRIHRSQNDKLIAFNFNGLFEEVCSCLDKEVNDANEPFPEIQWCFDGDIEALNERLP